ncbi:hypothetical protein [Mycolicibacterium brumae]|uniref:DUF2189 domain-containing protein n=1 Tax=Mycolicibacterium brumae TaxID=85968 RepID=A0A2G5PET1_9MYCO|nr:hypothetical protein [Mycolicibacterium brumae]MCV7191969.1 hypothetical protein [Mycolicibacterium brumae]PIB76822.1 hypothetical protein CQY22_004020 [Mycolicibacterium brumae]RWA20640.1 hypothetical protein MBRU_02990 [Mycolicibacterium brumae DSM 44177]UWW07736.1 hypothetical protein L2Z93_000768 [Mycolicibacterium brumae]
MTHQPPFGAYPQQPGYGQPAPFHLGEAFGWAWNKFTKNPAATILPVLIIGVIFAVVFTALWGSSMSAVMAGDPAAGDSVSEVDVTAGTDLFSMFVFNVIAILLGAAFTSAYYSGALELADGRPVTVSSFIKPRRFGAVVAVMLIIGATSSVINWLIVLPANNSGSMALSMLASTAALVVALGIALFTMFAVMALLDRGLSPVEALKFSIALVRRNLGTAIVVLVTAAVICIAGAMLCGVGILVAAPVAMLLQTYTWRKLTDGHIAPVTA